MNIFKSLLILGLIVGANIDYVGAWPFGSKEDQEELDENIAKAKDVQKDLKALTDALSSAQTKIRSVNAAVQSESKANEAKEEDVSFLRLLNAFFASVNVELDSITSSLTKITSELSAYESQVKKGKDDQAEETASTLNNLLQNMVSVGHFGVLTMIKNNAIVLLQYMKQTPRCPKTGMTTLKQQIGGKNLKLMDKNKQLAGIIANANVAIDSLEQILVNVGQISESEIQEHQFAVVVHVLKEDLKFFDFIIKYIIGSLSESDIDKKLNKFIAGSSNKQEIEESRQKLIEIEKYINKIESKYDRLQINPANNWRQNNNTQGNRTIVVYLGEEE